MICLFLFLIQNVSSFYVKKQLLVYNDNGHYKIIDG